MKHLVDLLNTLSNKLFIVEAMYSLDNWDPPLNRIMILRNKEILITQ